MRKHVPYVSEGNTIVSAFEAGRYRVFRETLVWNGILAYKSNVTVPIEKSFVKLKWRLDEVYAPWVEG